MRLTFVLILALCLTACGGSPAQPKAATVHPKSVIFIGDSITMLWNLQAQFGQPYINKGISGDTTVGVLARFQTDVISAKPDEVVILVGTNDVGRGWDLDQAAENIVEMAEQATKAGIRPILCTIPPSTDPTETQIPQLNLKLLALLAQHMPNAAVADYYGALQGKDLSLLLKDGIHPTQTGYDVMAGVVRPLL